MITTHKRVAAGAVILCVALLLACGKEISEPAAATPASDTATMLKIRGAGSTFAAPLIERWIKTYAQNHPGVSFSYDAVGSGEGIERFIAAGVDFGASDAAMNDAEIARVQPPAGRGVKLIPVTAGEVVIAYDIPDVSGELRLPRDVYVDIFLGRISRWDDLRIVAANPDMPLPAKRIQVVARRDSSGTTFAFTNHLSAISQTWRDDPGTGKLIDWPGGAMIALGNEGVAQRLRITRYSIGYLEYGFARRLGLPMAALENRAGEYVAPGPAGGKAALDAAAQTIPDDLRLFLPDPPGAGAYPVVSLSWLLLNTSYSEPAKAAALRQAADWGLVQGQSTAEAMGYIPLPETLIRRARQALDDVR
ncbi:MAG: phosphate ABC transporter substrate-binding protein PstS [Gammaproteobacteria bacterium]